MNGTYRLRVLFAVFGCAVAWVQHINVRSGFETHRNRRFNVVASPLSSQSKSTTQLDDFASKLDEQMQKQGVHALSISDARKNLGIVGSLPEYLQDVQSVHGRYVKLKGATQYQLAYKGKTNEKVKNYDLNKTDEIVRNIIGSGLFRSAHFLGGGELHKLEIKTPPGTALKYRYKVEKAPLKKVASSIDALTHDRAKSTFIPLDAPFLQSLGITYKEISASPFEEEASVVRPRVGMADKLGQIQKFLEILDVMIKSAPKLKAKLGSDEVVKIVDMGSGLAYLTFAAHAHFVKSYPMLQTVGVERRADLTDRTNTIARELAADFGGLSFQTSAISDAVQLGREEVDASRGAVEGVDSGNVADVLIALHACDTATDDAILQGVKQSASIIVVSPCCHKEVRCQLELHKGDANPGHALTEVLVHGIYRERQSEMLTDTIRALCLQCMGYDTKIFEFISSEHTAKNTMIAATRRTAPLKGAKKAVVLEKISNLMVAFGVKNQHLVSALGLSAAL